MNSAANRPRLSYISLFSGGGVGCFGFHQEGFECVATVELLPKRLEIQIANGVCRSDAGYISGNLMDHDVQSAVVKEAEKWTNMNGAPVTALIATPPCQGMSVANLKKGDEQARNSLVVKSLEVAERILPDVVILENVRAFLNTACTDSDGRVKPIAEAINYHLASKYLIYSRTVNFKDFGAPSSRTRTLVIATRFDRFTDMIPADLFPSRSTPPTLRELIGDLPSLSKMGQVDSQDIYHAFRPFDTRMMPWLVGLPEGSSAFDNAAPELRPHRIVNGRLVPNKRSTGDKYRRTRWDQVAPCVHTRNDILASQSTIHPQDNRVFSIRELCRMMGVPDSFKWSGISTQSLNKLSLQKKTDFLRERAGTIRQCLGEGVPTPILGKIAKNIVTIMQTRGVRGSKATGEAQAYEKSNPERKKNAAFYTRSAAAWQLVSALRKISDPGKRSLRILEPSIGAGSLLPSLSTLFRETSLEIEGFDIDVHALKIADQLSEKLRIERENGLSLTLKHGDFLKSSLSSGSFDICLGNPPFGTRLYPRKSGTQKRRGGVDIYAVFLEEAMRLANRVAFILPKSFLATPSLQYLRDRIAAEWDINLIIDFGEAAFTDIAIETIGMVISRQSQEKDRTDRHTEVISWPQGSWRRIPQSYVANSEFPTWLLYRNSFFDQVFRNSVSPGYKAYRDRRITKSLISERGTVPVVQARDIPPNGEPISLPSRYLKRGVENVLPAWLDKRDSIRLVVPNLSYYPRAAELPTGCAIDGSAAVLWAKEPFPLTGVSLHELMQFYSSSVFFAFYRIARNYSTRTLNIDRCSAVFWVVPNRKLYAAAEAVSPFIPSSRNLLTDGSEFLADDQWKSILGAHNEY